MGLSATDAWQAAVSDGTAYMPN